MRLYRRLKKHDNESAQRAQSLKLKILCDLDGLCVERWVFSKLLS
jgi:hypothetical protein